MEELNMVLERFITSGYDLDLLTGRHWSCYEGF